MRACRFDKFVRNKFERWSEVTTSIFDPPINYWIPNCTLADIAILNFQIFFHSNWARIHATFELNLFERKDQFLRKVKGIYPKSLVLLNVVLVLRIVSVKHHITDNQWPLDFFPLEDPANAPKGRNKRPRGRPSEAPGRRFAGPVIRRRCAGIAAARAGPETSQGRPIGSRIPLDNTRLVRPWNRDRYTRS